MDKPVNCTTPAMVVLTTCPATLCSGVVEATNSVVLDSTTPIVMLWLKPSARTRVTFSRLVLWYLHRDTATEST